MQKVYSHHSDSSAHCFWWKVDLELGSDCTTPTMGLDHFTPDYTSPGWVVLVFVGTLCPPRNEKNIVAI